MSIFSENKETKVTWPAFKFKTGKKIKQKIDANNSNESEMEEVVKKTKASKENEKVEEIELDEIIDIPKGSILRIDGEEFQIYISIKEDAVIDQNFIHKKVINPNGIINKWEYKNGELKYDKEDNIFYYVIESPKKG